MLSTAHRILDNIPDSNTNFYKKTHVNHPCNKWTRTSKQNYEYLFDLWIYTCLNYELRYKKPSNIYNKLADHLVKPPKNIADTGLTKLPRCMPDEFKVEDVVQSYRNYYIGAKQHIAKWKNVVPDWYKFNGEALTNE